MAELLPLVHIEQLWEENALTLEGHYMHERVHDDGFTEARGSVLLSRGMPVRSQELRITGVCDMVELYKDEGGVTIQGRNGRWRLYPVEYKLGQPDLQGADALQLCAQAMCLEEMFVTDIPEAALYYGKIKRRQRLILTGELRQRVKESVAEMQVDVRWPHAQGKDGKSLQKLFSCGNLPAQTDETGFGIGIYPQGVPRGG